MTFEKKNRILKANAELRKETGELRNIYFLPDLTRERRIFYYESNFSIRRIKKNSRMVRGKLLK